MPYNDDIKDPNYSIFNGYNFFIGHDPIRLIILFYIFFCFVLNILIIIVIFISKKKLSFVAKITLSILGINFIHTFSYSYEWVIKTPGKTKTIEIDDKKLTIGLLLTGNLTDMGACHSQAFLLISSSISQDFLINIFFYLINKSNIPKGLYIWLSVFFLAIVFPCVITLIILLNDSLGINDRFCYVKKFEWRKDKDGNYGYDYHSNFELFVTLVCVIRILNLLFSAYLILKIVKYVAKKHLNIIYIFKISYILIVQFFTITVGVIYRISSYFSKTFSENFSGLYLLLNTIDGILFPLSFIIINGMHKILISYIKGENVVQEEEDEMQYPNIDSEEDDYDEDNVGKNIPMTDLSKKSTENNFNIEPSN
jgi:hypothetical protein